MQIKRIIKRSLQYAAAGLGPHRRSTRKPQLVILMYHRVLPADHPEIIDVEPGMVVTPNTLAMHLRLLRQYFEMLTLGDWLARRRAGKPLPAKACAVTFDDGWRDNADFAFPVLQSQQVPASIFLVSDWIGTSNEFWPERLARLLRHTATRRAEAFDDKRFAWLRTARTDFAFGPHAPSREQLSQLFLHCKQWRDDVLHERLDNLSSWLGLPPTSRPTLLDWEQVDRMADSGLVEFGSHTRRHIRLNAQLDADTMAQEIRQSRKEIADATGRIPETFCYPNGDYTDDAIDIVRECYRGAVTTLSGWNRANADAWQLRRIGVHEDVSYDEASFLARLSGWI